MFFKKEAKIYNIKRSRKGEITIDMPPELAVLESEQDFIYHLHFNKKNFPKTGLIIVADNDIIIYKDMARLTVDDKIKTSSEVIHEANDLIIIDNDPRNTFFQFSFGLNVELPYSNEENMERPVYIGIHGNADSGMGVSFRILPDQEDFLNFIRSESIAKSKEEIQAYFHMEGAFNVLIKDSINKYIKENKICYTNIKGYNQDLKNRVKEDLKISLANDKKLKGLEVVAVDFAYSPLPVSLPFIEEVENRQGDIAFGELEGKTRKGKKEDLKEEREFEIEKLKAQRECPHCHQITKSKGKFCSHCGHPLD